MLRQPTRLSLRPSALPVRSSTAKLRAGHNQRRLASGSAPSSSSSFGTQRVAYGALASIAVFSAILGYSVNELTRRGSTGTKEAAPRTWQDVTYGSRADVEAAIVELRKALPRDDAVNTVSSYLFCKPCLSCGLTQGAQDPSILYTYGFSENTYHPSAPHAVVVRPRSTEEVSAIVKIANKYRVPVIPYGAGTSLEGHYSGVSSAYFESSRGCGILLTIYNRLPQARFVLTWME